jgi:ATP/ADP translocase
MLKITEGNLRKSLKSIFKRMNAPYKIIVVNEVTLLEAMTIHLTKKSLFILIPSLFVGLFMLFSGLIFFTPLKHYIPGNNK